MLALALMWLETHNRKISLPLESLPSAVSTNEKSSRFWWSTSQYLARTLFFVKPPFVARPKRRKGASSHFLPSRPQCVPLKRCFVAAKDFGPYDFQAFTQWNREEGRAGLKRGLPVDNMWHMMGVWQEWPRKYNFALTSDISQQTPTTAMDFMFSQPSEQWRRENREAFCRDLSIEKKDSPILIAGINNFQNQEVFHSASSQRQTFKF